MTTDLLTIKSRLKYLLRSVDGIQQDPNRGRLLALLLYWKVFDGIDIPDTVMKNILERGTNPESLGRLIRFALEDMRTADREADLSHEDSALLHESGPGRT